MNVAAAEDANEASDEAQVLAAEEAANKAEKAEVAAPQHKLMKKQAVCYRRAGRKAKCD